MWADFGKVFSYIINPTKLKDLSEPKGNEALVTFAIVAVILFLFNTVFFIVTNGQYTIPNFYQVNTNVYGVITSALFGFAVSLLALNGMDSDIKNWGGKGSSQKALMGLALSYYPSLVGWFALPLLVFKIISLEVYWVISVIFSLWTMLIMYYTIKHTYDLTRLRAIGSLVVYWFVYGFIFLILAWVYSFISPVLTTITFV